MTDGHIRPFLGTAVFLLGVLAAEAVSYGSDGDTLPTPDELKKMSLEELMQVEVTLVSRHPENLNQVPSAVQVLTRDDIRRFGVFTLPEALRLAANLQVAQIDARQWAISARGQNNPLSNKLLVMIDGRTVYTPLYAGVFWDVQNIQLDNVDRIEIISGPGGTLWGANAVNGVINIVTRGAEETQGWVVGAEAGTFVKDVAVARFGGKAGPHAYYRLWGRRLDHNATDLSDGTEGMDDWSMGQGGFRADWLPGSNDRVSVLGGLYVGSLDRGNPRETPVNGQNVLARWTRDFSEHSGIQLQTYYDRSFRHIPNTFKENLHIVDVDFQQRFGLGDRNALIWGSGYRFMRDEVENGPLLAFLPANRNLNLFNIFLQDEITLIRNRLKVEVGSKLEHTDYSGFEVMPSGRLAYTPDDRQTIWAAVSRAVRSPSRIDVDFFVPAPPIPEDTTKRLLGGPDFEAENLIAYEIGYRAQPLDNLTGSVSAFYNWYDGLRIIEPTGDVEYQYTNGAKGEVRGVELSAGWQVESWWRLRCGYTLLEEEYWAMAGHAPYLGDVRQGNDPEHQFLVQSMMDLPKGFQLNGAARHVSSLPSPFVQDYSTLDAGVAWRHGPFSCAVIGHNLAVEKHPEFGAAATRHEIPREISGRVAWRF